MFEIELADDGSVVVEGRLDAAQAVKAQTFLDQVDGQCVLDMQNWNIYPVPAWVFC